MWLIYKHEITRNFSGFHGLSSSIGGCCETLKKKERKEKDNKKNSAPGASPEEPRCSVYPCLDNGRVSDRSLISAGGRVARPCAALRSEKGETLQALASAACSHPGAASA